MHYLSLVCLEVKWLLSQVHGDYTESSGVELSPPQGATSGVPIKVLAFIGTSTVNCLFACFSALLEQLTPSIVQISAFTPLPNATAFTPLRNASDL